MAILPPLIDERPRLETLDRYAMRANGPSPDFGNLLEIVESVFDVPIAAVSFVGARVQWFAAPIAPGVQDMPVGLSFCAAAVSGPDLLVVEDAAADPRFASSPIVAGPPHVRFYAGAPLLTSDGHALGTLCIMDTKARGISPARLELLSRFSAQAMALVERDYLVERSNRTLADKEALQEELETEAGLLRAALDGANLGWWEWVVPIDLFTWGGHHDRIFGIEPGQFDGTRASFLQLVLSNDRERVDQAIRRTIEQGAPFDERFRIQRPDGGVRTIVATGKLQCAPDGKPLRVTGIVRDVTRDD